MLNLAHRTEWRNFIIMRIKSLYYYYEQAAQIKKGQMKKMVHGAPHWDEANNNMCNSPRNSRRELNY